MEEKILEKIHRQNFEFRLEPLGEKLLKPNAPRFFRTIPEIPPTLPFSKGGEPFSLLQIKDTKFPPWKKGDKGGFPGGYFLRPKTILRACP
jgi:hypothetical protein